MIYIIGRERMQKRSFSFSPFLVLSQHNVVIYLFNNNQKDFERGSRGSQNRNSPPQETHMSLKTPENRAKQSVERLKLD